MLIDFINYITDTYGMDNMKICVCDFSDVLINNDYDPIVHNPNNKITRRRSHNLEMQNLYRDLENAYDKAFHGDKNDRIIYCDLLKKSLQLNIITLYKEDELPVGGCRRINFETNELIFYTYNKNLLD